MAKTAEKSERIGLGPLGFRRILVATDGSEASEHAVSWAAAVAKACGSSVRVLAVVAPETAYNALADTGPLQVARVQFQEDDRRAHEAIAVAQQHLLALGVRAEATVTYGYPESEIGRDARSWAADLVIVGSHSRAALGRWMLGSVADAVKDHVEAAVLVARTPAPPTRMLAGIDGSDSSRRAAGIAMRIARRWKAFVHLEHVYDAPVFGPIQPDFERTLAGLHGGSGELEPGITYHVGFGRPADTLVLEARRRDCGLIVVGSRGLGTLRRAFLGSVSNRIVHEAPMSVLVVKRDG
ncbi:MAG: universal stress protein [Euryarchaeota archaeon]|nr:universal stress protein [Euryarchaeota archaeon]